MTTFGSFSVCPGRGTREISSSAPLIRRIRRVQYPTSHAWAWFSRVMGHTVAGEGPMSLPAWSIFFDLQRCRRRSQLCCLPSRPSAFAFSRNSQWRVQQSFGVCSVLPQPLQGRNFRSFCGPFPLPPPCAAGFAWLLSPIFLDLSLSCSHWGAL